MAKLVVSAFALIAMVGLIEASPVFGALTGGVTGQGQTQGVFGGLTSGTGLLGGVVETATGILNSVLGGVRRQTEVEVEPAIQEVAEAAAAAAAQAKTQGLSVEQALINSQNAALLAMQPHILRVAQSAAVTSVSYQYNTDLRGRYPGLVEQSSQ